MGKQRGETHGKGKGEDRFVQGRGSVLRPERYLHTSRGAVIRRRCGGDRGHLPLAWCEVRPEDRRRPGTAGADGCEGLPGEGDGPRHRDRDLMKSTKYLLIGGGLASSQAAKQLREHDGRGAITLVGEEPYVPYDRPPLSKEFLRGEKRRDELFFDPEQYFHDQDIGLVLGVAVQRLNLAHKTAILANGEAIRFEKALTATGGRPVRLKLPGGDLPGVHYLRTLDDSDAIATEAAQGKRAVHWCRIHRDGGRGVPDPEIGRAHV